MTLMKFTLWKADKLISLVYKCMQTGFMHSTTEQRNQLKLLLGLISERSLYATVTTSLKGTTIEVCYIVTVTDTSVKPDVCRGI